MDSLALGLRVVVRVTDGVVADGDRFNIGGNDPDPAGVGDDAVVVKDRLPIKLGLAAIALLGCRLQCGLRAFELSFHRVSYQFSGEFLSRRFLSGGSCGMPHRGYDEQAEDQSRNQAACRKPERVFLPRARFHHIGGSTGFKHFRLP